MRGTAGSNPGSVHLGGQRVPIRIPRVRGVEGEIPLRAHVALQGYGEVDECIKVLLRRVLYGISCRNDAAAAQSGQFLRHHRDRGQCAHETDPRPYAGYLPRFTTPGWTPRSAGFPTAESVPIRPYPGENYTVAEVALLAETDSPCLRSLSPRNGRAQRAGRFY